MMADRQRREYVVRRDGVVEERVTGVKGPTCEQKTRAAERRLGTVVHREYTPEYAATPDATPPPRSPLGAAAEIQRDEEAPA